MFKNYSIKKMLIGASIIVVTILSLNLFFNYQKLSNLKSMIDTKEENVLPNAFNFLYLKLDVIQVQQWLTDVSVTKAKPGYDDGFDEAKKYFEDGNKMLDLLIESHKKANNDKMVAELEQFKIDFKNYYDVGMKMAHTYIEKDTDEGNKMMSQLDPFAEKLGDVLESWIKNQREINAQLGSELESGIRSEETLFVIFGFILIVFLAFLFKVLNDKIIVSLEEFQIGLSSFFSFLNRETTKIAHLNDSSEDEFGNMATIVNKNIESISKAIKDDNIMIDEAKEIMSQVKHGWYSNTIKSKTTNLALEDFKNSVNEMIDATKDHFSNMNTILQEYSNHNYTKELHLNNIDKDGVFDILLINVNKLKDSINEMLRQNQNNGLQLGDSADNLLKNVSILNQNSNSAAAALEETSASLEEVTTNISSNTENIIKMANLASDVTHASQEGQRLANETTAAMDAINKEVNAINEAISIIDQIAFQTNILSLNAAVEAATAGEAGKGFAVVAQEVRNLATRSADAANEIKKLVENAKNKANSGKNIADKMIDGYVHLNENIAQTTSIIKDVEVASKEQLSGIEQINSAINALDRQTQQNASIASQTYEIAISTDKIAKIVVEDAQSKEFIGKEKSIKKSVSSQNTHEDERKSQPAVIKKVAPISKNEQKQTSQKPAINPIVASSSDDDTWESF